VILNLQIQLKKQKLQITSFHDKLFRLKSRFLVQKEDGTFAPTEEKSGVVNPHFAITSLVSDFNQDGYLDMIWVNIDTPSLAYINKGGDNNYLQVDLGESVVVQGAKVTVTTPSKTLTEWLVTGEGLASDQTALLQFGLGNDTVVSKVTVILTDGKVKKLLRKPTILKKNYNNVNFQDIVFLN